VNQERVEPGLAACRFPDLAEVPDLFSVLVKDERTIDALDWFPNGFYRPRGNRNDGGCHCALRIFRRKAEEAIAKYTIPF
jgi:hypothetical protein